jgi:hypothetical protein
MTVRSKVLIINHSPGKQANSIQRSKGCCGDQIERTHGLYSTIERQKEVAEKEFAAAKTANNRVLL